MHVHVNHGAHCLFMSSWSVTPVDFEDRYEVNLEADFEVDVPMPVVTIEPRKLDMEFLQAGHISTINFKLTNHGWIRAEDVKFTLPDVNEHPFMRLEMVLNCFCFFA